MCISLSVDGRIWINILIIYYKLGQGFVTNWGSFVLLQIGASVITNWGSLVITKWGSYYKLGSCYYKLGQLLQIGAIIPNWGITVFSSVINNFLIRLLLFYIEKLSWTIFSLPSIRNDFLFNSFFFIWHKNSFQVLAIWYHLRDVWYIARRI